eukprot:COSAG04_NODE_842_length_9945_cov_4.243043_4_plen_151_part_00
MFPIASISARVVSSANGGGSPQTQSAIVFGPCMWLPLWNPKPAAVHALKLHAQATGASEHNRGLSPSLRLPRLQVSWGVLECRRPHDGVPEEHCDCGEPGVTPERGVQERHQRHHLGDRAGCNLRLKRYCGLEKLLKALLNLRMLDINHL